MRTFGSHICQWEKSWFCQLANFCTKWKTAKHFKCTIKETFEVTTGFFSNGMSICLNHLEISTAFCGIPKSLLLEFFFKYFKQYFSFNYLSSFCHVRYSITNGLFPSGLTTNIYALILSYVQCTSSQPNPSFNNYLNHVMWRIQNFKSSLFLYYALWRFDII